MQVDALTGWRLDHEDDGAVDFTVVRDVKDFARDCDSARRGRGRSVIGASWSRSSQRKNHGDERSSPHVMAV